MLSEVGDQRYLSLLHVMDQVLSSAAPFSLYTMSGSQSPPKKLLKLQRSSDTPIQDGSDWFRSSLIETESETESGYQKLRSGGGRSWSSSNKIHPTYKSKKQVSPPRNRKGKGKSFGPGHPDWQSETDEETKRAPRVPAKQGYPTTNKGSSEGKRVPSSGPEVLDELPLSWRELDEKEDEGENGPQ